MRLSPAILGACIYLGLALAAALTFIGLATGKGEASWASRSIGAGWVFLLTTIILMPVVIPRVRGLRQRTPPQGNSKEGGAL
ncbi:hypothetical protein HRbin23_00032 [bacterium HR23]|nr:hypothetical protein HRbin23_00032 [bacterium HR23]